MQIMNAKLRSMDDVLNLVRAAESYDTDIELVSENNFSVCAKSLIGVVAALPSRRLKVIIHSDDIRIKDDLNRIFKG